MSVLDKIVTSTVQPPMLTIYGAPGVGKSTLASQFPDPLFLLTENTGLTHVKQLPVSRSFQEFWSNLNALLKEETLPFKTLVIDSITKVDALVVRYILEVLDPKAKSINSALGGYGSGFNKAQEMHRGIRQLMQSFIERGIAVVFIGHTDIRKFKSPDEDEYDVYTITMNSDKSREPYINDVDGVFFCHLKTFIDETSSGRTIAKSNGDRIISTGLCASNVSKHRFPSMPDSIPMSFDEIAKHIPFYQQTEKK